MRKKYLLFLIFPISQVMIIVGNYMALGYFDFLGYVGILLGITADVILFYILVHGSGKERMERELEEVQYQRESERIRMEMLEEQKKALLLMEEEFEKCLQSARKRMENGNAEDAEQELEKLQEQLEKTRPNAYCQNMIVNAVLDEKERVCEKIGGTMEVNVNVPAKLGVEPFCLCSIFANLLDNAIEAIEELEQAKRQIEIDAGFRGNYLFVKVKNNTTRRYAERKKREGRGNGIQILKNITQKYEGNYKAEYKDGVYTATLMLKAVSSG